MVFSHLAHQARFIPKRSVLAGWLHRDTRYTALDFMRAEGRRYRREKQFMEMNPPHSEQHPGWDEIRPLLDEALTELPPADRNALLLRFFEQRDFAEVGAALGASAEAARKRVDRALERLREYLVKRGVTTTAVALGGTLLAHAVETVPAGFVVSLAAGSIGAARGSNSSWISSLMIMTKTKMAIGLVLAAGILATPLIMQQQALAAARAGQLDWHAQLRALAVSGQASKQAPKSFDRTERDRADLERLRREALALRTRLADLSAQAERLLVASSTHRPGANPLGKIIRFGDLRDAGQATPEATMESFLWAMLQGETNRISQFLALNEADSQHDEAVLEKLLGELTKESSEMRNAVESGGMESFAVQILEGYPGQNDDQWVVAETIQPDSSITIKRLLFCQTDTGWKWVVGPNGKPVEEDVNQP